MQPQRPVYWYSGQFLEPQHLQQTDAFHTSGKAALLEAVLPCFWGVGRLNVDEVALAEGQLVIRTAALRFQDGTEAVIADILENGNALLPSRYFRDDWKERHAPFTVFVGLPPLKPSGNVAGIPVCERNNGKLIACDADTLPEASGRYLCPNTDDSIADRYALPLSTESLGDAPVRTLYLYP
ncbi:MAG: type VI secretion system baseplate subunit TssK, partial [Bilophila sp.]